MKPKCKLNLDGPEGNVFAVIAKVKRVLIKNGLREEAEDFNLQAFECKTYDEVLELCNNYVEVE